MDGDEDDRLAGALRRALTERTRVEPGSLYDQMSDDDALDLAWFVVEVLALEATLGRIIVRHGTPKQAAQVDSQTLGTQIGWVEPFLERCGVEASVAADLRELNRLRIAVLHHLPEMVGVRDRPVWSIEVADGPTVDVDDLHPYGVMAWKLRERLAPLVADPAT